MMDTITVAECPVCNHRKQDKSILITDTADTKSTCRFSLFPVSHISLPWALSLETNQQFSSFMAPGTRPHAGSLLTPHLESAGYETHTVSLPSVSATNIQEDFTADVITIASAITALVDKGRDVAIIMHSYGGIPGSAAVKGLTKSGRQRQGKQGGVSHLVYCAAFMPDEGVSLADAAGASQPDSEPPDWWIWSDSEKKSLMPGGPEERFYNDVSDKKVLDGLVKALKPHAVGTYFSKNTYAAWKDLPTTYIACSKDNAIPIEGQHAMVEAANAALKQAGRPER